MRPQTVVLLATPKILPDFANPEAGVASFLDHYSLLTSQASETIVIFAVGNSDHILNYRGIEHWGDTVEWARYTDGVPVSRRILDYHQLKAIADAFKARAASLGMTLKVFDQIDSGLEFTANEFKMRRHPECMSWRWGSYEIRGRLVRDTARYASAPDGIVEGTLCAEFLAEQVARYIRDLGFNGILYGNQLGTRGRWWPGNGPGYSEAEATAILAFLEYSARALGDKELMWFDSYNNRQIERDTWSFPSDGYRSFDYLIASGFCVITFTDRYVDNLESKLQLTGGPRVLATLDYVDPWYTYNSMTAFPGESARLEELAIGARDRIDGIVFFANDQHGAPVPRKVIEAFAKRFFGGLKHSP
ncbi:MAG TPA: hypothetical protein VGA20_07385 [Gemmatimonadales bacterium]